MLNLWTQVVSVSVASFEQLHTGWFGTTKSISVFEFLHHFFARGTEEIVVILQALKVTPPFATVFGLVRAKPDTIFVARMMKFVVEVMAVMMVFFMLRECRSAKNEQRDEKHKPRHFVKGPIIEDRLFSLQRTV